MTRDGGSGLVILVSGRGSNLRAILDAVKSGEIRAKVHAVISNVADCGALKIAEAAGIPVRVVAHRDYATRAEFDRALERVIDRHDPQLVVLAGFMRILTNEFIERYQGRLINIHPSLLPDFPGLNTHQRAIEAGAKRHGASVHFVTPEVDTGPVIIQAAVPVTASDTVDTLSARVLEQEHRIFPLAIKWFIEGRLSVRNGRVLLDGSAKPEQGLIG